MSESKVLNLNGISCSYKLGSKTHTVIPSLDLEVSRGELIAITGASGSGKSTLLYLMACLKKPDSGTIEVFDKKLSFDDAETAYLRNHHFGFVFQDFHLVPELDVLQNVLLPSQYAKKFTKREYKERALALITRLGLEKVSSHKPNQLSGGQQQRVAIARALIQDPEIIFADEPTGALDSKTTQEVLQILKEINEDGRTIIMVTHDSDVADFCQRQIILKDGEIVQDKKNREVSSPKIKKSEPETKSGGYPLISMLGLSLSNLKRNKSRTFLTMFGLCVGIMSVLILISIGHYTEDRVLEGYENLGVNKLAVRGNFNWRARSRDNTGTVFDGFDYKNDLKPLKQIFPQVKQLAPILRSWDSEVSNSGQKVDRVSVLGTTPEYFRIEGREAILGELINHHHVLHNHGVCVIGLDIVTELFRNTKPVGQIINIKMRDTTMTCKVIGVLNDRTSNDEWFIPNKMVVLPFSYFQAYADWWRSKIRRVAIEAEPGTDLELLEKGLKSYYTGKYGNTIRFRASRDDLLASNLKKFMTLFNILMICIAGVTLTVGGTGVTNMMLIAIAERFHEIGVRKAYGATQKNVLMQFLTEGVLISFLSGVIGIVLGFACYQGFLYLVSQVTSKVEFAWIIYPDAFVVAYSAIFAVGVLASLVPAMKASKLEVIEALRSS